MDCVIIEDEREFVEILTFHLNQIQEINIIGDYGDTVQAAIQIEKNKPELIFLDINISGLDGPEFVDLLSYEPKIIVVSAHSESFMKHYPEVTYADFIQKPPTLEKIKAALEKCKAE